MFRLSTQNYIPRSTENLRIMLKVFCSIFKTASFSVNISTLMMNAAIFFPLYSTILHWLAAGSDELKAGGESDLKLKHNYTPSLSTQGLYSRQNLIPSHINITLGRQNELTDCCVSSLWPRQSNFPCHCNSIRV